MGGGPRQLFLLHADVAALSPLVLILCCQSVRVFAKCLQGVEFGRGARRNPLVPVPPGVHTGH